MSQECSNREAIAAAILKYMKSLPEPKSLPREIALEIVFEEATERHRFDCKADTGRGVTSEAILAVVEMYHNICVKLPRVRDITAKRKQTISVRMRKYKAEDFVELFTKASKSDFLAGKNDRGWVANFDWLLNENNIVKVLEGAFDNRGWGNKGSFSSITDDAVERALSRSYSRQSERK